MVTIRNFTEYDVMILKQLQYTKLEESEIKNVIKEWAKKKYEDKYFEVFAVVDEENIVGQISILEHSSNIIGFGVEIYQKYRRKGYAYNGSGLVLDHAKNRGYKVAVSQVRVDNTASLGLHKKLGFEINHKYVNGKGNEVYCLIKSIV